MKIIEVLKELPLLDKRIAKKTALIQQYSSDLKIGVETDLPFKTKEDQQKEVNALIDSVRDLVARKGKLRRILSVTNAQTMVKIDFMELPITDWIEMRQGGISALVNAQKALNDATAQRKINELAGRVDLSQGVKTIRFFEEKQRNDTIEKLTNILESIDAHLEMVNATTDVVEL